VRLFVDVIPCAGATEIVNVGGHDRVADLRLICFFTGNVASAALKIRLAPPVSTILVLTFVVAKHAGSWHLKDCIHVFALVWESHLHSIHSLNVL